MGERRSWRGGRGGKGSEERFAKIWKTASQPVADAIISRKQSGVFFIIFYI